MDPVSFSSAANISAQINNIPLLNGTNFKIWKEAIEIILGHMDLDLTLRLEKPISTLDNLDEVKIEKWERSNRMCLMIMASIGHIRLERSHFSILTSSRFSGEEIGFSKQSVRSKSIQPRIISMASFQTLKFVLFSNGMLLI
ncbi:hypothetical protein Lal_00021026 [Lupinus albus]|nr:hypothetical protein Lal_00021026 [Lupinus albus]